jgi:archaeal flagellar protein FlaJ
MKFKQKYLIGITAAVLIIIVDFFLFFDFSTMKMGRFFLPLIIIALTVGWAQFWMDFFNEQKRQKEVELKFLEFIRNVVGAVKSGVSVPQAIINISDKDYGALTPYVKKLNNQIELGIPLKDALITYSNDTNNGVIKRSVAIIIEAEESGGNIEDVLESVGGSVIDVKKMKAERKASVYSQVVQGYIVYFVFIAIMLVLQVKLFPKLKEFAGGGGLLSSGLGGIVQLGETTGTMDLDLIFFFLIIIQGFFAGIMIGKFSEGTLKNGLVHSLIMVTLAILIVTIVKGGI